MGATLIRGSLLAAAMAVLSAAPVLAGPQSAGKTNDSIPLRDQLDGLAPDAQAQYLAHLVESGKETAEVDFYLGNAYYSLGQFEKSIAAFKRAIELRADYTKAMVNLGLVEEQAGSIEDAEKAYRSAIEADPSEALAMCHLGSLRYAQREFAAAMDLYKQALAADEDCAQAYYNIGVAFADARMFREAIVSWERVVELDGDGTLGKTASQNVGVLRRFLAE